MMSNLWPTKLGSAVWPTVVSFQFQETKLKDAAAVMGRQAETSCKAGSIARYLCWSPHDGEGGQGASSSEGSLPPPDVASCDTLGAPGVSSGGLFAMVSRAEWEHFLMEGRQGPMASPPWGDQHRPLAREPPWQDVISASLPAMTNVGTGSSRPGDGGTRDTVVGGPKLKRGPSAVCLKVHAPPSTCSLLFL